MAGQTYSFEKMFPGVKAGMEEILALSNKIDDSIKKVKLAPNTGDGLKTVNTELKTTTGYMKSLSSLSKQRATEEKKQQKEADKYNITLQKQNAIKQERINSIRKEARESAKLKAEMRELNILSKKQTKSDKELIRYEVLLVRKKQNLIVKTKEQRKEYNSLTKQILKVNTANRKADAGIGRFQKNVGNYTNNIKGFIATLGLAGLAFQAINWVKEGIKMASVAEGVKEAFDKLNNPKLLANLREATRGTVNDLVLMQNAVKARNFKIPLDKLAGYFEFATKRAAETGESVDFLVDSLINGIGKKSTPILDNLGISANALQQEMKLTGDFAAAAGNIIDKELSKMGDVMLTAEQKTAQLNVEFQNLSVSLGDELIPIINEIGRVILQSIKGWKLMIGAAREYFNLNVGSEAQKRQNAWKKELEFQTELTKKRNLEFKRASLERAILKQVNFLKTDKTILGFANQEGREARKRLLIYREQLKLLNELAKTDFFEGQKKRPIEDIEPITTEAQKKAQKEWLASQKKTFDELQKLELSYYKNLTDDAERIKNFKLQQQVESLEFALTSGKKLNDVQRQTIENEIKLLEKEKEKIVSGYIPNPDDPKTSAIIDENIAGIIKRAQEAQKEIALGVIDEKNRKKKGFLARLLGVSDDDASIIKDQVVEAFNQAMSLMQQGLDRRREANDEILTMTDERIDKLNEELETEKERVNELKLSGAAYTDRSETIRKNLSLEQKAKEKALEEDKKLKQKQKRLDLVTAGIQIAGSVIRALNSPAPFNIILAGITAALGFVQLAQIKAAKYAKGTTYVEQGGNPSGTDTVPAMVDVGERITSKKDNAGIPRTFPNSMLATAVNYYLDKESGEYRDNASGTPILNLGYNDVTLDKIEQNTRNNKVYHNGKLIKEIRGHTTHRYN